jgi:hypothetical protein
MEPNSHFPEDYVVRLHRATHLSVVAAQRFIATQPAQLTERILLAAEAHTDDSALRDPFEKAPETAATIAEAFARAERETDAEIQAGYFRGRCHAVWHRAERILRDDFRIEWFSPARINPGRCFD